MTMTHRALKREKNTNHRMTRCRLRHAHILNAKSRILFATCTLEIIVGSGIIVPLQLNSSSHFGNIDKHHHHRQYIE